MIQTKSLLWEVACSDDVSRTNYVPQVPELLKDVRIPAHYGRQSTISRTVKPGHNTIDIEIDTTSAASKSK